VYLVHAALGVEAGGVRAGALGVPGPPLLLQQLPNQALHRLLHLQPIQTKFSALLKVVGNEIKWGFETKGIN